MQFKPSIEYLELFAVTAAVLSWIHKFKNKRVILFCDNRSVVDMINNTSSSCKNCMVLIRMIVLKGLIENVRVFARHVEGVKNELADSLSRNKIEYFKELSNHLGRTWDEKPTTVPEQLWPISKIWKLEFISMFLIGQRPVCRVKKASDTTSSKSSQSSKISVEYMTNVLERLSNKQTRDSTTSNYLSI